MTVAQEGGGSQVVVEGGDMGREGERYKYNDEVK